ncbi:MAG: hypothetical protein ACK4L4_00810 [Gemmobacter sp.]
MTPAAMADLIRVRAGAGPARVLTAIAGPPGAGKSTLAAALVTTLGPGARVVPMDGFHYDDAVLNARGLRGHARVRPTPSTPQASSTSSTACAAKPRSPSPSPTAAWNFPAPPPMWSCPPTGC